MKVACLGGSSGKLGEPVYDAMVEVGQLLAQSGATVLTGGFGGAGMEAPARGAVAVGGQAIGYTMLGRPGNEFLSEIVDCSVFNSIELAVEAQYGIRLGHLLSADSFIVSVDDCGPGTLVELLAIANFNQKVWNPRKKIAIVALDPSNGFKAFGLVPQELGEFFTITSDPEIAVSWVV